VAIYKIKFLYLLILFNQAFTAASDKSTIKGRIIDGTNNDPLPFVNVFLSNTTYGSATDLDGNFEIKNISPGIYDMIVTRIGYKMRTYQVTLTHPQQVSYEIRLYLQPIAGEEIRVVAKEPKEWKSQLEKFCDIFLGRTLNASQCRFLNPEVLDFEINPNTNELIAYSDSIVRIENRALGYRLHLLLKEFRGSDTFSLYMFYPRFEPLPEKEYREAETWATNRKWAYFGSFKHFLSALARDRLEQEHFVIFTSSTPRLDDRRSRRIDAKDLHLQPSTSIPGAKRLEFSGYLKVVYTGVAHKGTGYYIHELKSIYPVSFMKLNLQYVLIDTLGNNLSPLGITKYGWWDEQRVADLLPLDYIPTRN
jgi:hypothetical protein